MNRLAHALGAAAVMGTAHAIEERQRGEATALPLVSAGAAALCGSLPDLLEPAIHPNHRQICHSVLVATGLVYGLTKLYRWEPQDDSQRLARWAGLIACGAYVVHLAMDAATAKSIPFIGNLS